MDIKGGDSITFGEKWCLENDREELTGKTVKLEPQYFEYDNGLYVSYDVAPGIPAEMNDYNEEADSIYHLFGNTFERFMDCTLIKGSKNDHDAYFEKIENHNE